MRATAYLLVFAASPALAQSGPGLTLHPSGDLTAFARRVAGMLEARTGLDVHVGSSPAGGLGEAVEVGSISLEENDGHIRLFLPDNEGVSYSTVLELERGDAGVRATALAIESLLSARGAHASEQAPTTSSGDARSNEFVPVRRARRPTQAIAKPLMHLSLLAGYSPAQHRPLLGPGAGLGLCVGAHCAVIEGDLSLLPERRRSNTGEEIRYRFVNMSVRFQFRPWKTGVFVPGISGGLLTRFGRAVLQDSGRSATISDLGVRTALEGAYRFAPPFEAVLQVGVDFMFSRARFLAPGGTVLLEDEWTPWVVASVRLRPEGRRSRNWN